MARTHKISTDEFVADKRVKDLFKRNWTVLWHTPYNPCGLVDDVRGYYKELSSDIVARQLCGSSGIHPTGWAFPENYQTGMSDQRFSKMRNLKGYSGDELYFDNTSPTIIWSSK